MRNPTSELIELRHYYENLVAQSESQATQARAQIEHIDALLVNSLLQAQQPITLRADVLNDLPILSAAQLPVPAEPQPAPKDSSAKTSAPKAKAEAAKASGGRESFPLLPQYQGMTKLESISQILSEQSGHVLHQDTITQLLYGDLSPEVLKVESRRMRASLFQGVTKGLWQRAPKQPSCYVTKATSDRKPSLTNNERSAPTQATSQPDAPSVKPGRSSAAMQDKAIKATSGKPASRGRTQVLSLPPQYAGLSKIDTVAKVLEENAGTVMHMDEIIRHLYGTLSDNELKAEKVRMKDVMTRGVQRKLWQKAKGVSSSIVSGASTKPTVTEERVVRETKSPKVTVLEPKAIKTKKPRKASPISKAEKPKRKKAEVVALLRNANIKI
jgi:hypothetical protein